ncbi:MAG: acyltransferase family protein, partial [Akkermansia sp.]
VLGTVLLIKFGANLWSKKILESRVFVGIGKISYSLYLWHWPIIVYWTYCTFGENNLIDYLGILILSFSIAYASWRFVETPIRKNKSYSPAITLSATLVICLIIGSISLFLFKSNFIKNYFYPRDNQYYANIEYWKGESYSGGDLKNDLSISPRLIKLGNGFSSPSFILCGDSHAMAVAPGINKLSKKIGINGLYDSSFSNLLSGISRHKSRKNEIMDTGDEMNALSQWLIQNKKISTVLLVSRWGVNALGCGMGKQESHRLLPLSLYYLKERTISAKTVEENLKFFEKGLRNTCQQLKDAGKQVILFSSIPEREYYTPDFYWRLYRFGLKESKLLTNKTSLDIYYERQKFVLDVLKRLQDDHLAIVIDAAKPFLEGDGYVDKKGDVLLYKDDDHLSPAGAVYLIDEVKDQIIPYLTKPDGR